MDIKFLLNSGKNRKLPYYIKNYIKVFSPKIIFQKRLSKKLDSINGRCDANYIWDRVSYYNKLDGVEPIDKNAAVLGDLKKGGEVKSVYFFDAYEIVSWFNEKLHWNFLPGDITQIPGVPTILKSRPIRGDNRNSVVLKLEKIRHFIFLNDTLQFPEKQNKLIFRGKMDGKPHREKFMRMYFDHPMCDLGNITKSNSLPEEWKVKKSTLYDHLKFKFILALEGNDVASNLKWIMSSNSIAVMPEPTYETWFMEGKLIPDFHYIRIKNDYTDLEERLNYYIENQDEAQKIIDNAHDYVAQFFDKKREKLIGLAVMDKYLKMTGQE